MSRAGAARTRARGRWLPAVLVLASATVIAADYRGGADSPVQPLRTAVADVAGPVEETAAMLVRPLTELPDRVQDNDAVLAQLTALEAENAELRGQLAAAPLDRDRLADYDGLMRKADETGYALLPARVVALGPAQSFSRTVTIDAGTTSGVHPDMTVLDNDGLVGRVVSASRSSATVLLVVDRESVVGGRLASSQEIGFLRGRGGIGDSTSLDLDLLDPGAALGKDDLLVTWGSRGGAPYVAGIPIGTVTAVHVSPRDQAKRAVIDPLADFSSLDLVGVVVDADAELDRPLIRAASAQER